MRRLWIVPYAIVSIVHVVALAFNADAVAAPTKLLLMPLLALAVLVGGRGSRWGAPYTLLLAAIALSWLGDGAGTFFPFAPTLPMMLLFFGLAHLCYIWLFWRKVAVRRVPPWALIYAVWWGVLIAVLWPHLGGLAIAVAVYGLVLGGTAVATSRCHPLIAWGGAFFLTSDSILAFRLFLPDAMPDWTSPLVMLTYTLGQGLIAAGVVVADRIATRSEEPAVQEVA
ncbi:lysoplasmalogenase [Microbacterium immunditiarum]|uniref:Putative membrane protein YhhN n=1 Tax=Microbacterium immunditiarum TaxID=337480 RepID=A0A7Y9GQ86_9MICO|nr:lysoplasmalogenase [Microbacterium immunditiarum]NYE20704.1 putative membrane protein YhhN [Microbacterium immunditiarum]